MSDDHPLSDDSDHDCPVESDGRRTVTSETETSTETRRQDQRRRNRINAAWGLVEYGAQVLSLLVLTPLLVSRLGLDAFGILTLVGTVIGLNGLFSLGIGPATLRYIAKYRELGDEDRVRAVVGTSLVLSVILGAIGGVVMVGLSLLEPYLDPSRGEMLGVLGIVGYFMPLVLLCNVVNDAMRGFERFDGAVIIRASLRLVTAAVQITMVLLGYSLWALVAAQLVVLSGLTVVATCWLHFGMAKSPHVLPQFSREAFRDFASFGFFTWLSSMVGTIRQSGEMFLVGGILGAEALGVYSIPVRILTQVHTMLSRVFSYQLPFVSKLAASDDESEIRRAYNAGTRALCLIATIVITPLAVCCGPLLKHWLGDETASVVTPVMQILAIRYAVFPLSILNYNFLLASGRAGLMTGVMMFNTAVALPLVALLAYRFGVHGAAYAQWFVLVTIVFNRCLIEKKMLGRIHFATAVVPVLACVAPLASLLWWWPISLDQTWVVTLGMMTAISVIAGGIAWAACLSFPKRLVA